MKKATILFAIILLALSAVSCGGNNFIDDGNGHKQYKDSSGNFVKNDWAEIKGKKYFFDMNGYLVTNQWVQDEYYVDDKGAMQTNYWYDDKNGKMYYLGKDGKYVKDTIMTIDNNEYAFNTSGELVKNAPYVSNGVGHYFGNDGKIDKTEGYRNINGTYCYVKDDGSLLISDWKEDEGKWYYFNDMGLMLKNSFVDGGYYVDENGEMVKSRRIKIGNNLYSFNDEGIASQASIKKSSGIWRYYSTNNGTKYVVAEKIQTTTNFVKTTANIAVSNKNINIVFRYSDSTGWLGGFGSSTRITISINGTRVVNTQKIEKVTNEGETIYLTDEQYRILLDGLKVDGSNIKISIFDDWGNLGGVVMYSFDLDTTGFNEVYLNL